VLARDADGNTPQDLARASRHTKLVPLLREDVDAGGSPPPGGLQQSPSRATEKPASPGVQTSTHTHTHTSTHIAGRDRERGEREREGASRHPGCCLSKADKSIPKMQRLVSERECVICM
jgi:hypothetical protein